MAKESFVTHLVDQAAQAWSFFEKGRSWIWILLISFLWLASTTWVYPLLLPDEGSYVEVARAMLSSGDFLTPHLESNTFFDRPPLFYWLTALFISTFGDNAWAARLCSVIAASGLVTVIYVFLRRYTNINAARQTAIILLIQPFLFGAAHYANLDMLAAALMSLAILAGADAVFRHEQLRSDRMAILFMYLAVAASFLAKGLVGFLVPAGVLFFWLIGRRQYQAILRLLWWPAITLFILFTLPWLLIVQSKHPGLFNYYIIQQHFSELLEPGINNQHPFWFYLPVLFGLTLPWAVQLWRWFYPSGPLRPSFLDPAVRIEQISRPVIRGLMLSWLLVVLIFFSMLTSRLIGYIVVALPPLAWFIQETFEQRISDSGLKAKRSFVRHILIAASLCLLGVLAVLIFPLNNSGPQVTYLQHSQELQISQFG